jgi:hypothetical protein
MKGNKHMKTITNIIYPALALFTLACFGVSQPARAVCQEGCNLNGAGTTVLGDNALVNNMGSTNTAIGSGALLSNTFGGSNTATGAETLETNTTGNSNTATGSQALENNTTGFFNTATGISALINNTEGSSNTASGSHALETNTTGGDNTATGYSALFSNNGSSNTADGVFALPNNTTGSNNIALGNNAGLNLTTGSNNIDIGNAGVAGESARIRIGTRQTHRNTFIAGISGVTVPAGIAVIIDNSGHLGTTTSSARFKEAIKPMDKTSEVIVALKPVTFRYKHDIDPAGVPQFGLVAEEVEKVDPDLVAHDEQGKPYSVRYDAVNAMLLNEFLKEHRKNEKQEATIAQLEKQVEALTAGLQKVSAQLELSKPALKTVLKNQ